MTGHTHSLAEWAEMVSLAVAVYGTGSVFYFLTVDADPCDFDPRPAVARALESGRFDGLLVAAGPVLADVRHRAGLLVLHVAQARDRARLAAVHTLLALTLRHTPKGIR